MFDPLRDRVRDRRRLTIRMTIDIIGLPLISLSDSPQSWGELMRCDLLAVASMVHLVHVGVDSGQHAVRPWLLGDLLVQRAACNQSWIVLDC